MSLRDRSTVFYLVYDYHMKLYVTRHGQTNYNVLGLCNADETIDVYLTPLGVEQARQVSQKLKEKPFEVIYISTLKRTRRTADIINEFHNVPIEVDERIMDNVTGFEGKPVSEYYAAREGAPDKWGFKPEGAESLNDVKSRVQSFLNDLRQESYEAVLIVAHQSVNRMIYGVVNGASNKEIEQFDLPQGDFIEFEL